MRRGFSLPGIMALSLFLFVLFMALHGALRMNRQRLALQKHRQAAFWLAVSGADLAEARVATGEMKAGETLLSPGFQQGRFEVTCSRRRGSLVIVSKGVAAGESHLVTRKVAGR